MATIFNKMAQQRGKEIDKEILKFLRGKEWPCTTEDIAKGAKVSWQTAQIHLFKMNAEGKIKYRRVGRQNQWWANKEYGGEF